MTAPRRIEDLPRRNATRAKNEWGKLQREARSAGGVVVTHHGEDAMVVLEAGCYRDMVELVEQSRAQQRPAIAELTREFDQHLAGLQDKGTHGRMDRVLTARGRTRTRPKAGPSF